MRHTKFKAQTKAGQWLTGGLVYNQEKPVAIIQQTNSPIFKGVISGWCLPIKPETAKEFTGFTDYNGHEIYEGDNLYCVVQDGETFTIGKEGVFWCKEKGGWMIDESYKQDQSSGYPLGKALKDSVYFLNKNEVIIVGNG